MSGLYALFFLLFGPIALMLVVRLVRYYWNKPCCPACEGRNVSQIDKEALQMYQGGLGRSAYTTHRAIPKVRYKIKYRCNFCQVVWEGEIIE